MPVKLGDLLLREKLITPQQLQAAQDRQKLIGGTLRSVLVDLGFLTDEEVTRFLSHRFGVPSIDLDRFEIDPAIIKIISAETARKYQVLPLSRSGATLTIAMADPTNVFAMDDIRFMTGYDVEPVVASEAALEEAIDRYYGRRRVNCASGRLELDPSTLRCAYDSPPPPGCEPSSQHVWWSISGFRPGASPAPAVQLVNGILLDSVCCGASEIQIELRRSVGRVSYRLKGRLREAGRFPKPLYDRIVNRLRLMSGLSLADRRKTQEGYFHMEGASVESDPDADPGPPQTSERWAFEFAVSILPIGDSHKVVLRRAASEGSLALLAPPDFSEEALFRPSGSFRLRLVSRQATRTTRQ